MQTSIDKSALGAAPALSPAVSRTAFSVLGAISFAHLLNDMIQSLILAIYPMFKSEFSLSFGQIGLITLTYQITASLLQPLVGLYTDKHPKPYSLAIGMGFTLAGLLLLRSEERRVGKEWRSLCDWSSDVCSSDLASLLQPLVGLYTDKHPKPYSLAIGMGFTLAGLLLLSVAGSFPVLLIAAAL